MGILRWSSLNKEETRVEIKEEAANKVGKDKEVIITKTMMITYLTDERSI